MHATTTPSSFIGNVMSMTISTMVIVCGPQHAAR